jgi:hypothetical protein
MTRGCRFQPACLIAVLVGAAAAGCTMCPDPYDYSGPVPNGSAPQNDFRARSNGIIPIGVAPRPWPPIVKQEEKGAGSLFPAAEGDTALTSFAGQDASQKK